MTKKEKGIWIAITAILFIIQLWPLGILSIIIGFYLKEKKKAKSNEQEAQIYKTAAEIEHSLNRERDSKDEIYYR